MAFVVSYVRLLLPILSKVDFYFDLENMSYVSVQQHLSIVTYSILNHMLFDFLLLEQDKLALRRSHINL